MIVTTRDLLRWAFTAPIRWVRDLPRRLSNAWFVGVSTVLLGVMWIIGGAEMVRDAREKRDRYAIESLSKRLRIPDEIDDEARKAAAHEVIRLFGPLVLHDPEFFERAIGRFFEPARAYLVDMCMERLELRMRQEWPELSPEVHTAILRKVRYDVVSRPRTIAA